MAPHYVHMFESIFCSKRPWVFGHLYLPGGSKSLGATTHGLASGSKAPLVGVLMQVGDECCRHVVGRWFGRSFQMSNRPCLLSSAVFCGIPYQCKGLPNALGGWTALWSG